MEISNYSKQQANAEAAEAVAELRRSKLAAELTNTELGSEMQVSRQSVSKKFRNGDMRLSDFIQIARLAGDLPSSILAKAEAKSALAGKEAA